MTTRKPEPEPKRKPNPATSPLIEWPAKEDFQLPVTVEHKEPARDGDAWHVETKHQSTIHLEGLCTFWLSLQ